MRIAIVLAGLLVLAPARSEEVKAIRGPVPIPETNPSQAYRIERNDRLVPRSHRWQPPVIPHNIKGYQITKNVNTCLVCHSRATAPQSGATPVGTSHYFGRDGREMQTVSAQRYFCLQCHVAQADADPLVESTFRGPGR